MARLSVAIVVIMFGVSVVGCGSSQAGSTTNSTSGAASVTTTVEASNVTTTTDTATTSSPATTEATTTPQPSAKSLQYAKQLGGTSHKGQTLYFVIGVSKKTEAEAQAALNKATPSFGDMQAYFIVQRSDNFEGMTPGWWIVIESYRNRPSDENLQFDKRGFSGAYVKQATVRTSGPIPVYEDLAGE